MVAFRKSLDFCLDCPSFISGWDCPLLPVAPQPWPRTPGCEVSALLCPLCPNIWVMVESYYPLNTAQKRDLTDLPMEELDKRQWVWLWSWAELKSGLGLGLCHDVTGLGASLLLWINEDIVAFSRKCPSRNRKLTNHACFFFLFPSFVPCRIIILFFGGTRRSQLLRWRREK